VNAVQALWVPTVNNKYPFVTLTPALMEAHVNYTTELFAVYVPKIILARDVNLDRMNVFLPFIVPMGVYVKTCLGLEQQSVFAGVVSVTLLSLFFLN